MFHSNVDGRNASVACSENEIELLCRHLGVGSHCNACATAIGDVHAFARGIYSIIFAAKKEHVKARSVISSETLEGKKSIDHITAIESKDVDGKAAV